MRLLGAAVLFLALLVSPAQAGDRVEAALYWAHNGPARSKGQASPSLGAQLHQVFGFQQYELVKGDWIDLNHTWTQWFIPRRDFFICLKPLRPQPEEPRLVDYEIYQEGFILAKGKYEPSDGTPLFINGPDFKRGRLIFVLEPR